MGCTLNVKVVSNVQAFASWIRRVLTPAQSWEKVELVPAPLFQL